MQIEEFKQIYQTQMRKGNEEGEETFYFYW